MPLALSLSLSLSLAIYVCVRVCVCVCVRARARIYISYHTSYIFLYQHVALECGFQNHIRTSLKSFSVKRYLSMRIAICPQGPFLSFFKIIFKRDHNFSV